MKAALRLIVPATALLFIALCLSAAVPSTAVTGPGPGAPKDPRESTYPAPVSNITQDPWNVQKGQNIQVTLTLHDPEETPDRVSMIWCRVEPDYVCALPLLMKQDSNGSWSTTIPGAHGGPQDVIQDETRHIGYNISLQYTPSEENRTKRVWAPTHNTWTPDTYPADSVGEYYFIPLQETGAIPAPAAPALLIVLLSLHVGLQRSKDTRKKTRSQQEEAR